MASRATLRRKPVGELLDGCHCGIHVETPGTLVAFQMIGNRNGRRTRSSHLGIERHFLVGGRAFVQVLGPFGGLN